MKQLEIILKIVEASLKMLEPIIVKVILFIILAVEAVRFLLWVLGLL